MKLKWWHIALLVILLAAFFSPLASDSPDGLEKIAEDKGFIEKSRQAPYELMADYLFPGVQNEAMATILAGIIGTFVLFGLIYGVARLLRGKQETKIR